MREFQELLSTEVEVDWDLISVDEVADSLKFSVRELSNIGWLFTEFAELSAAAAEEVAAEAAEAELVEEVEEAEVASEVG